MSSPGSSVVSLGSLRSASGRARPLAGLAPLVRIVARKATRAAATSEGMCRGTEVVAEDRVLTVLALPRGGYRRRGADTGTSAAIPAASRLEEVAADRPDVAQLGARRQAGTPPEELPGSAGRLPARSASSRLRSASRRSRSGRSRARRRACRRRGFRRATAGRPRCPVNEEAAVQLLDVKRLHGAPRSAFCFASASRNALSISSREMGNERTSAPVASRIAFAIAAATGTIGGSPSPFEPRFVRCSSGMSSSSVTISGTSAIVGDLYASSVWLSVIPVAGSSSRSSESVCPMPWMIPPSTWLDAPSGFTTRPTSWNAATRSTRISPVSMSTATSATWTPNVSTCIPVGLGPRAPLPRICAS